jgi:hypothetical protein
MMTIPVGVSLGILCFLAPVPFLRFFIGNLRYGVALEAHLLGDFLTVVVALFVPAFAFALLTEDEDDFVEIPPHFFSSSP